MQELINFEANEPWLFPTADGRLYMPGKFYQNIQRMLKKAGMPSKPNHPNKMSQAQQVQQLIPLHCDLVTPFTKYLAHFKTNEALFVRSTSKQWNRKDVHQAIVQLASECGLKTLLHAVCAPQLDMK